MVSHLFLASFTTFAYLQDIPPNQLSRLRTKAESILLKAYAPSTTLKFEQIFWNKEPEVLIRDSGRSVTLRYAGGQVSFFLADERPGYFTCSNTPNKDEWLLNTEDERKERALEFTRAFYPRRAFQIERNSLGDFFVREMEDGIAHYSGLWLSIANTGTITHGGFPGPKPTVLRQSSRVHKDVAVASAIDTAIMRDPELDTFEVRGVRTFWIVPDIEYMNNAPEHAKSAARQKMAIKAYHVGAIGFRSAGGRQKHGSMWVDAETGRTLSGRLVEVDGFGSANAPKVTFVEKPQHIFLNKEWKPIKALKPQPESSTAPKGDRVLVKQGNSVCRAYLDKQKKFVWIPTTNSWVGFKIAY